MNTLEFFIQKLFWLLSMHALIDFHTQFPFAAYKKKDPYIILAHSFLWTAGLVLVLSYFDTVVPLWKILFLFFGHALCDWSKHRFFPGSAFIKNTIDQSFHFVQILITAIF